MLSTKMKMQYRDRNAPSGNVCSENEYLHFLFHIGGFALIETTLR